MMKRWLVRFYGPGGECRDALEHASKHKPTRWAKGRCYEGETFGIEERKENETW